MKIKLTHRWGQRAGHAVVAVLLVLIRPAEALALDPARAPQQYGCQTWSRQNGLPANGINAITQTKDGYIWLGTQSGLVRFDGVQLSVINLPEGPQYRTEVIASLGASRDNGLWFGIANGTVGFYDGQDRFSQPEGVAWLMPNMNVTSVCETSDGSLWVGTGSGVGRYAKGKPDATLFYDQLPGVRGIVEDSQGRVWLPTATRGLYYWEAGTIMEFPDASLKQELIAAAIVDRQGQIWVGTTTGLRCYDSNFQRKEIPPFATEAKVLLLDQHGVVWIGTNGDGLACYKNGAFSFLRQSDGLVNNFVTALFEDREGSLWVGTRGGLSQLTDVKFPIYSAAEGLLGGLCHGVSASAKGGLWVATSDGVSYFDGKTATNYPKEGGISDRYTKRVFEAKNGDLFMTNGAKAIEILSQGKIAATFTCEDWPTALTEDSHGVVVAVAGKLFLVSRAGLVPYPFEGPAPALGWIRNLLTSRDGALWVASVNGILRVKDGVVQHWSSAAGGLSGDDVYGLCEDDEGVIWAGLPTGIARIKNGQIRNISRTDGLLDDSIFAIVSDNQGQFWINSSRGIFRVSQQDLNDFCDEKIRRFASVAYNGINAVKTIDTAEVEHVGCKTADGRIWFPSPLGVIAIDPTNLLVNETAPLVSIESVRANGNHLAGHHRQVVPPGMGELEFHFAALSFIVPQKLRFRYQLEGYDKDWVETENRRLAFYTNLKPGSYTFRVTAANADGVWNDTGDALEIELQPHFYQATWFYLLGGAVGLSVLVATFRWRVRLQQSKEQAQQENRILLETEVRNRTAELQRENTERKLAEAELRAKTALLEAQVDSSIDGILVVDTNGKKVFQNQRTIDLWKIPPEIAAENNDQKQIEFVVGRTKHPDQFVDKVRYLYAHPRESSRDEIEFKDGMVLDRYSAPVIGKDGTHYGRIWAFRDITERKRSEAELEKVHRELLKTSRQAGMAEVATSVLHNVGNVLNSVNVSAGLVVEQTRRSKSASVGKVSALLHAHQQDLGAFLTNDSKGKKIPTFLAELAEQLAAEQAATLAELEHLRKNIDHINEIVARQQSLAKVSGVIEEVSVVDLVEDALRMEATALAHPGLELVRDYQARPTVATEQHKVLEILVNLVRNAKHACEESGRSDKSITLRSTADERCVRIAVIDNGVGIPAENLTRIFNHGFTTRKDGHGFGLHSGALVARELGGSLIVQSAGPNLGATLILELPYKPKSSAPENPSP